MNADYAKKAQEYQSERNALKKEINSKASETD